MRGRLASLIALLNLPVMVRTDPVVVVDSSDTNYNDVRNLLVEPRAPDVLVLRQMVEPVVEFKDCLPFDKSFHQQKRQERMYSRNDRRTPKQKRRKR